MRRFVVAGAAVLAACQGGPSLSSTAQEVVIVSPTSHDFGTITVGQLSASFTESINPSVGNQYDTIDSITASCPDFTVDAPGLPTDVYRVCEVPTCFTGGQICSLAICQTTDYVNYTFQTSFHPSVAGPQSCVVTISLNAGTTFKSLTLSGTGMAPPIDIDVAPTSINFGDVRRSTDSTAAGIAVRNLGGGTLNVSSVALSAPYTLGGPSAFVLGAGATQDLSVTCHPTATGQAGGQLVITSDDPVTPSVAVALACNGIDSNLGISPSPASFAATRVGEPQMLSISVTNSGGASTVLESVTLTGAGLTITSAPAPNTTINAAETLPVTIAFDAAAHGDATGTLTVTTTTDVRTVPVSASAKVATMSLTPDGAVDFGPVCSGQTAMQAFTVLGNGDGPFQLESISDPGSPFTLTHPALPANVQASGTNQVMFMVTATPAASGVATQTVMLTTDIPGGAPRAIELGVTGLAAGVSPTPTEADLGTSPVNQTTVGQAVMITNCNADALAFSNARIEGPDASEFTIVAQPMASSIAPTKSVEWLIVMTAHTAGPKEASFVVDHDGGPTAVPLTGEGFDPNAVLPGGDETSYYTCSAGGGVAAWPLILAFAWVLGRRRRGST